MSWKLEAPTVTLREPAALRDESVSTIAGATSAVGGALVITPARGLYGFVKKTLIIAQWEALKILHDPTDLVTRAVQPLLWLLIFGQVFAKLRGKVDGVPYEDFL